VKRSNPLLTFAVGMAAGAIFVFQLLPAENDRAIILLEKALRAPRESVYRGTSVTYCYLPKPLETRADVWHKGLYRERIGYLTGPLKGYTIGCDGTHNWQSDANAKTVKVTGKRASEEQTEQRFDLLVRNYRVTLDGAATLAGRPASILTVKPRNLGNPWRRLWIDQKTFVALRTDDYLPNDRLKTRTVLETIDYSPMNDDLLFSVPASSAGDLPSVPMAATRAMSAELIKEIYNLDSPRPAYLPPGYELERYYLYRCECGDKAVLARFVDGLNTLSIFAVPAQSISGRPADGSESVDESCCTIEEQRPAVEVQIGGRGYRLVVLGDIADSEIKRVAESFEKATQS